MIRIANATLMVPLALSWKGRRGIERKGSMSTDEIEVTPGSEIPSVFDDLGERLYLELRQAIAVSDLEWSDLDEGDREFYRTAAEGLILDLDLVSRAHALQIAPPT